MHVHFIAIGGSAMHNLAIALKRKGLKVTGSDDKVFEPSRSRLAKDDILPKEEGWFPEKITENTAAVIVGMHARQDNPELAQAKALNIPYYSYPEYIYEQTKNQTRVVIGGSHGKTTITSMLLHVCKQLNININYMVGAQLDGYDCMVKLDDAADFAVLEGDEYLSSPTDLRPKFHLYHPNIALISGIAWDHINVFPTFENYVAQFDIFCQKIESDGSLIYNTEDAEVKKLGLKYAPNLNAVPYQTPQYEVVEEGTVLHFDGQKYPLQIFGQHNLQNLTGAARVGERMGINLHDFLSAMANFQGAGKRLQRIAASSKRIVFKDFAHSPSKLKATVGAVREQFPNHRLTAYMELHTFSSLNKDFLPEYEGAMDLADDAVVYYNPEVVAHKKLENIAPLEVQEAFGNKVLILNETQKVLDHIHNNLVEQQVILLMTSGNFDGIDLDALAEQIV
jgi:UDP-N-acetylmuramate: L-alanyl-gamma-D-glutamyl-meso-diaminopimelate ligase